MSALKRSKVNKKKKRTYSIKKSMSRMFRGKRADPEPISEFTDSELDYDTDEDSSKENNNILNLLLDNTSSKISVKMANMFKFAKPENKLFIVEMNVGYILEILDAISFLKGKKYLEYGMTVSPLSIFCCTYISIIFAFLKTLVDKFKETFNPIEENDAAEENKTTNTSRIRLTTGSLKKSRSRKKRLSVNSKTFLKSLGETGKNLKQSIANKKKKGKKDNELAQFYRFFTDSGYVLKEGVEKYNELSHFLGQKQEQTAEVWNNFFSKPLHKQTVQVVKVHESCTEYNVDLACQIVPYLLSTIVEAISYCYNDCVREGILNLKKVKRKFKKISKKISTDMAFKQITQLQQFFKGYPFNFSILKGHLEIKEPFLKKLETGISITEFENEYPDLFRKDVLEKCVGKNANERFTLFFLKNVQFGWQNLLRLDPE